MSTRAYLSLARLSARTVIAYRMNFVLGMFGFFFQMVAMFAIWQVLLNSGSNLAGFTLPQIKAYLLIAFASSVLVSFTTDWRMAGRVLDGDVALDITKPVDFQASMFARALGSVVVELAIAAVVAAVTVVVAGPIAGATPARVALFMVSMAAVVPIKFSLIYLTGLICFFTQNYLGIVWARDAIILLMSGALIPLVLLPGWLQGLAAVLPFASLTSTPALIYLGRATGGEAALLIGVQVVWGVVLWFGARPIFSRALRRLTVHGG